MAEKPPFARRDVDEEPEQEFGAEVDRLLRDGLRPMYSPAMLEALIEQTEALHRRYCQTEMTKKPGQP